MNRFSQMIWGLGALVVTLTSTILDCAPGLAQSQPLPLAGEAGPPRAAAITTFPESYVLGAGDRIRIDIFNIPEFSGPENGVHEVLFDGTLALPLAGTVNVQGLTLPEAQAALAASYAPLLTRPPQLTVTLLSVRPVRVVVAGEVNHPGTYLLPT